MKEKEKFIDYMYTRLRYKVWKNLEIILEIKGRS